MVTDAQGNVYVGQINERQVTRFDVDGNVTMVYGGAGAGLGKFLEQPGGMVVDKEGRLWVNQGPRRGDQPGVYVFGVDGTLLGGFGELGSATFELLWPTGMTLLDGKVYVADVGDLEKPGAVASIKVFDLLPPLAP
jgi:DNA-binding beta-propeller fold protein YncE